MKFESQVRNVPTLKKSSKILSVTLRLFSYPSVYACVLGAEKNRLIEIVLLSTYNMFWLRKKNSVTHSYLGACSYCPFVSLSYHNL